MLNLQRKTLVPWYWALVTKSSCRVYSVSSNVLTKMEELQDAVENIKDDVLKRNVSPKGFLLKQIHADIDAAATEL